VETEGHPKLNFTLLLLFGIVAALLLLLAWALRGPGKLTKSGTGSNALEANDRPHVNFLPHIRQALDISDYEFLAEKSTPMVQRRVRRERQDVALAYLSALRLDFQDLLRMARIIAGLSPEIVVVQEFERLRLTVKFMWRYELIRMKLRLGFAPLQQLDRLGNLISGLGVRLEIAVKELGERAALVAESASPRDRRGMGLV
jgi:hypothetical protein